jgi:hypothetical protein
LDEPIPVESIFVIATLMERGAVIVAVGRSFKFTGHEPEANCTCAIAGTAKKATIAMISNFLIFSISFTFRPIIGR